MNNMTTRVDVLDHGFVELLDVMASDEDIEAAARVSYTGGEDEERTPTQRRHLLRYLMRHRHCYAPWMEVLTESGWKRWDECEDLETFLVPDPETRSLRAERLPPERFDTVEDLYRFENERMSYAVTGDHRMWFKRKGAEDFQIFRAHEMPHWGHFDPLLGYERQWEDGSRPSDRCVPRRAFVMELIGFYLGDGSHSSPNTITFHLRKKRKQEYLREVLRYGDIPWTERSSATYDDAIVFTVGRERNGLFWDLMGDSIRNRARDKRVPFSIAGLQAHEIVGLFRGLLRSDGHVAKNRNRITFTSVSPHLAKAFETLSAMLGYDAHCVGDNANLYQVYASLPGARTSLEARKQYFSTEPYEGKVYCATTSTGLLMVRGGPKKYGFVCGNTTPFEMAVMKFRIALPIFSERQMIRHRTASTNEFSGRYAEMPDLFYLPEIDRIQFQSSSNKQGSGAAFDVDSASDERAVLRGEQIEARESYEGRLEVGMAKELARINLPLSQYTVKVWKMDLHNLLGFLQLRLHPHAQHETRVYADAIATMVKERFPITWESFEDYRLHAMSLSRLEVEAIAEGMTQPAGMEGVQAILDSRPVMAMSSRERVEFRAKLERLGLA